MREVIVGEILAPVERNDLPQATTVHQIADRTKEGRIAEDMSDLEQPTMAVRGLDQRDAVLRGRRHRLFEQDMVAGFEESDRTGVMVAVHRGIDEGWGQLRPFSEFLPGTKLTFRRNAVLAGEAETALVVRFRDCHEA
jgi:hypothetical protein